MGDDECEKNGSMENQVHGLLMTNVVVPIAGETTYLHSPWPPTFHISSPWLPCPDSISCLASLLIMVGSAATTGAA